jgi:hypothetical protein
MNWYEKSTTDGKKENSEKVSQLRFCENSEKVQKKVGTPELRSVRDIRCAKFTKPPEKLRKKKRKKRRDKSFKQSADERRIYTYATVSIVHTPEENTRMYCPQGMWPQSDFIYFLKDKFCRFSFRKNWGFF